jgi:hypothetical protein
MVAKFAPGVDPDAANFATMSHTSSNAHENQGGRHERFG